MTDPFMANPAIMKSAPGLSIAPGLKKEKKKLNKPAYKIPKTPKVSGMGWGGM